MRKGIAFIESAVVSIALMFLLVGGIGLATPNVFAKRKITIHVKNLLFQPGGCPATYPCCRPGNNCEMDVEIEVPN